MIIDLVILGIIIISAVVAFFRGFIKEVLTIVGLGGAAVGAFLFGGMAVPLFESWIINPNDEDYKFFDLIPDDVVAMLAAYAAVFVVIFLVLTVIGHFLSKGATALGLGPVDRSLGVIFGLIRGVVLAAVLYLPFSIIMPQNELPDFVQESKFLPLIDQSVDWTIETAGIERPLANISDDEEDDIEGEGEETEQDTGSGKLNRKMIDRVREEYIGGSTEPAENAPPSETPERQGYENDERDALQDLIEGQNP